nr:MAG TPA: hypothetical protein [Caudoviricetes sp.]
MTQNALTKNWGLHIGNCVMQNFLNCWKLLKPYSLTNM